MIASYEQIHAVTIPESYRSVLYKLNGGSIYQMTLFGVPPLMARRPPQIDRSTSWPLDIGTAQTNWRIGYEAGSTNFFIGQGPWSNTEHLGYFLWPNGRVEALRLGGEQFKCWNDVGEFLGDELQRAEDLYPAYEDRMAEIMITARRRTSWWRRPWMRE
jgi:hypothetical protein